MTPCFLQKCSTLLCQDPAAGVFIHSLLGRWLFYGGGSGTLIIYNNVVGSEGEKVLGIRNKKNQS